MNLAHRLAAAAFAVFALAGSPSALAAVAQPPGYAPETPPAQQAKPEPAPARFVMQGSVDVGQTVAVSSNVGDLKFNGGVGISVGVLVLPLLDNHLTTQATIGFEYGAIRASDGSVRWLAFPLEIMEFFNLEMVRVGAGLSYLIAPSVKGDGVASSIDAKMKNSFGFIAEADLYLPLKSSTRGGAWWVGARYEVQKVENSDTGLSSDANAWGIVLGAAL